MMELRHVPVELAKPIWPAVESYIEKSCNLSNGLHTPESTFMRVESGLCHLWIGFEGKVPKLICTASPLMLPDGRAAMMIELVGGQEPTEFFAIKDEIEKWARDAGCCRMIFLCPQAWKKLLPDYSGPLRYLACKDL